MNRIVFVAIYFLFLFQAHGEEKTDTTQSKTREEKIDNLLNKFKNFDISGYGVINYYHFNDETLPDKRDAFDVERFNLYLKYHFNDKIELKTEIEFEHGGAGGSMEFDPLEEFGEFGKDLTKGGEVVLEQMNIQYKVHPAFKIRAGKLKLQLGNAAPLDRPINYYTGYRSEVENTLLPLGWYEVGIEFSGDIPLKKGKTYPALGYNAYLVSGLDNTGFSSLNFVRRGYQKRFEMINADNIAYALRLDYKFKEKNYIGFNVYAGNGSGNRPKKDFNLPAWLVTGDVHFNIEEDNWRITGYFMTAHLQNSEKLSAANRNLSNNLGVKRTPVGKIAMGSYIEAGYNFLNLIQNKETQQKLFLFGRFDYYDSMFRTEGNITDNPRYERFVYTGGINYFPIKNIVLKSHFSHKKLGTKETENTFLLGFGFSF
ncbi:MAG TPA: hypothetical protein VLZ75_13125 [Chitinophagales bacterium]|nr:hypothetical protein [Chitinophagales bacterium]